MPTIALKFSLNRHDTGKTLATVDVYAIKVLPSGKIALLEKGTPILRSAASVWTAGETKTSITLTYFDGPPSAGVLFSVNGDRAVPCFGYGKEDREKAPIEQSFADLERRVQKLEERPDLGTGTVVDYFQYAVNLMRKGVPCSQPLGEEAE